MLHLDRLARLINGDNARLVAPQQAVLLLRQLALEKAVNRSGTGDLGHGDSDITTEQSPLKRPSLSFLIGKLFKFYCRSYGRNYFGDVRLCIPSMHSVYVRLAARCPKWCRVLVSMLEGGLVCCGSRGQEHRIPDSIGEKCLWRIGLVGCVDIISACMQ